MLFSSATFLFAFLPAVLLLVAVAPKRLDNLVLLLASLLFYGWAEPTVLPAMLISIALNWAFGLWIELKRGTSAARWGVALAIIANLSLLAYYKYSSFVVDNLNGLIEASGGQTLVWTRVALPIGISFFTFQAMSYVIDVQRGEAPARRNPLDFALYIALFPQLIAGPIVRYRDIATQLIERRTTVDNFAEGVRRFLIGLAKKVLVANTVAGVANAIFEVPTDQITPAMAWLAMICYTLQIYYDFSGYSDMAIGLGRMFGFRFLENFQYPYISRSITEFWKRWHISLSSWFRDYLYIPLGGNRVAAWKVYRNLLLVFLLCGLWHGASWTFVLWGLWHGAFLVLEKLGLRAWLERRPSVLQHAYTLLVVIIGWVPFRAGAEGLSQTTGVLSSMFGMTSAMGTRYATELYVDPFLWIALVGGILGALPLVPTIALWRQQWRSSGGWGRLMDGACEVGGMLALLLGFALSAMLIAAETNQPFIYLRF